MKLSGTKRLWIAGLVLASTAITVAVAASAAPPAHFTDVSGEAVNQSNYLFAEGITAGCGGTKFCPGNNLDRATAAVLIIRAIYSAKNGPGSGNGDKFSYSMSPYFKDVPASHASFKWIQKMKELGITAGCKANQYCPDLNVQNIELAVFAARAKQFVDTSHAAPISFTFSATPYFSDVTQTLDPSHFPFVQREAELGVFGKPPAISGCGSGDFCGTRITTRGESLPYITRGIMGQSF